VPGLHEWFIEHFINPYATSEEIEKLANELGVSIPRLRHWLRCIRSVYWSRTMKSLLDVNGIAVVDELKAVSHVEVVDAAESAPAALEADWAIVDPRLVTIHGLLVNHFSRRPLTSALDDKCRRIRTLAQLARVAGADVGEMRTEIERAIDSTCPNVFYLIPLMYLTPSGADSSFGSF
jgi:hypothetical protein